MEESSLMQENALSEEVTFHIFRHAFSCNNLKDVKASFGKLFASLEKDAEPSLTVWGILQTLLKSSELNVKTNFVCVSSLLRTWLTSILLFLPNVDSLTLIVSPFLKESEMFSGDFGNMPLSFDKQIEKLQVFIRQLYIIYVNIQNQSNPSQIEKAIVSQIEKIFLKPKIIDLMFPEFDKMFSFVIEINNGEANLVSKGNTDYSSVNYRAKIMGGDISSMPMMNSEVEMQSITPKESLPDSYEKVILKKMSDQYSQSTEVASVDIPSTTISFNLTPKGPIYLEKGIERFIGWCFKNLKITDYFSQNQVYVVSHSDQMRSLFSKLSKGKLGPIEKQNVWELELKAVKQSENMLEVKGFAKPGKSRPSDAVVDTIISSCEDTCVFNTPGRMLGITSRDNKCNRKLPKVSQGGKKTKKSKKQHRLTRKMSKKVMKKW